MQKKPQQNQVGMKVASGTGMRAGIVDYCMSDYNCRGKNLGIAFDCCGAQGGRSIATDTGQCINCP